MRLKGKIIFYNNESLVGQIEYNSEFKGEIQLTFYAGQVINFNEKLICSGLEVEFSPVYLNGRKNFVAGVRDISIQYPKSEDLKHIELYETLESIEEDESSVKRSQQIISQPIENPVSHTRFLESIALTLFKDKIKIVTLTPDGEFKYRDENRTYHNIVYPSIFEEYALEMQIKEFEDMINSSRTSENDLQKFLENNPKFLLTDQYVSAHPHVNLVNRDNEVLIPDFVLQPSNQNAFCDLLDLKLPNEKLFIMQKNRERLSQSVMEAKNQLRVYNQFFDDRTNRENFQSKYPYLKIYKPKMFVVIGRRDNRNLMAQQEIMADNPRLILRTYDEILERMKFRKEFLKNKNEFFK
jgi:hypothetical protein